MLSPVAADEFFVLAFLWGRLLCSKPGFVSYSLGEGKVKWSKIWECTVYVQSRYTGPGRGGAGVVYSQKNWGGGVFPKPLPYLWPTFAIYDLTKNLMSYLWPLGWHSCPKHNLWWALADDLIDNEGNVASSKKTYPAQEESTKTIPYFWPKRLKSHTLWSRTYLYRPYKGVAPRDTGKHQMAGDNVVCK